MSGRSQVGVTSPIVPAGRPAEIHPGSPPGTSVGYAAGMTSAGVASMGYRKCLPTPTRQRRQRT